MKEDKDEYTIDEIRKTRTIIDSMGGSILGEMFLSYFPKPETIYHFKSEMTYKHCFNLKLALSTIKDAKLIYHSVWEDLDDNNPLDPQDIIFLYKDRLVNFTYSRMWVISINPITDKDYDFYLSFRLNRDKPKQFLFYTIGLGPHNELISNEFKISTDYKIDIDLLYNDDFKEKHNLIFDFIHNDSSGLVILSGIMGSGKTSYLRYLIAENYSKEFIIINNSLLNNLTNPEFVEFLNDHQGCILILEDCEQALKDRSLNPFENSVANILNLTDGLLADAFKIKMICTFNTNLKDIDPALTRKGRLVTKYEFKELDAHKVSKLNEIHNLNIPNIEPMTLANIFNYNKENNENKITQIGYGI